MKFEMELHPNFVSDIVVKQLQEMYEHTKEDYFYTDPEEAQSAIAVVLDYFMPPSKYAQWRVDNGLDRNLAEELVEGFDFLERTKELLEALEEAVYLLNPTEEDMQKKAGVYRVVTALEKLKEKNTVAL